MWPNESHIFPIRLPCPAEFKTSRSHVIMYGCKKCNSLTTIYLGIHKIVSLTRKQSSATNDTQHQSAMQNSTAAAGQESRHTEEMHV